MFAVFARRIPTQYIVVGTLIVAFLVFNCVHALIVNRRQIVPRVGTQLSTLRDLTPHQHQQQQQQGQRPQSGRHVERGDEKQPLLTQQQQEPQQQQPHSLLLQQRSRSRSAQLQRAATPSLQLDNSNRQTLRLPTAAL